MVMYEAKGIFEFTVDIEADSKLEADGRMDKWVGRIIETAPRMPTKLSISFECIEEGTCPASE